MKATSRLSSGMILRPWYTCSIRTLAKVKMIYVLSFKEKKSNLKLMKKMTNK